MNRIIKRSMAAMFAGLGLLSTVRAQTYELQNIPTNDAVWTKTGTGTLVISGATPTTVNDVTITKIGAGTLMLANNDGTQATFDGTKTLSSFTFNVAPKMEKASYLGVVTTPVVPALREQLKLKPGMGVLVERVEKDSPAEQAGIKRYDVLQKLDDQLLINTPQLLALIRMHAPGEKLSISLIRQGEQQTISATVIEKEVPVNGDGDFTFAPATTIAPLKTGSGMVTIVGSTNSDGTASRKIFNELRKGDKSDIQVSVNEGGYSTDYTVKNGARLLKVKDSTGKILFEGPIDTPEQRGAMPEEVKPRYRSVLDTLGKSSDLP